MPRILRVNNRDGEPVGTAESDEDVQSLALGPSPRSISNRRDQCRSLTAWPHFETMGSRDQTA